MKTSNVKQVHFVSLSELIDGLNTVENAIGVNDLDVSYGDADFTLLTIENFKEQVFSKIEDDLSLNDRDELLNRLENLPKLLPQSTTIYIDMEGKN